MKIGVLIPVHNEEKAIGSIVNKLKAKRLEAIVIDDGSIDKSNQIAKQMGAIVLTNEQKLGKGGSIRRGFNYILENNYDGVVMMDGDGQHDVEDIDKFLILAKEGKAIVNGNRMHEVKSMPRRRYLTNRFMSFLISKACQQNIPDTQCGYRYLSAELLGKLRLTSNDFEIETEILMEANRNGKTVYSVPIKTIYQDEISKINPLKDTLRFCIYFLKEVFGLKK